MKKYAPKDTSLLPEGGNRSMGITKMLLYKLFQRHYFIVS